MVRLELKDADAAKLAKAIDYYVSELRMEIANTDSKDMRDDLKAEEALLKSVSKQLTGKS